MRNAILLGGALSLFSSLTMAETPQPGTRDGDLACAALTYMTFQGMMSAKLNESTDPMKVDALVAVSEAHGVYIGRLSKYPDPGSINETGEAVGKLTTEEKTAFLRTCLRTVSAILAAHVGATAATKP